MKLRILLPLTVLVTLISQPGYSVTEAEFYKMQEQLQTALMKIQALEQVQKQGSEKKSGIVKTKSKKGLIMTIMTPDQNWTDEEWNSFRSQVKDVLVEDIVTVTFTKINGDERVMTCTLHPDNLPKVVVKEGEEKKERVMKNPENSLAVYDTKAEGWRSFVIRNIKSVNTSPRL